MQEEVSKEEKRKWLTLYESKSKDVEENTSAREILKANQKEIDDVRIFLRKLGLKRRSERGTYGEFERKKG